MKHRAWLLPSFVVLLVAVLIILIAGSTSAAPPIAQADRPKLDVPFVPTPRPVVDKMLELAAPTADDYLIDLGSGDGRIPITAAQRFGTRGLGIDIDVAQLRKHPYKSFPPKGLRHSWEEFPRRHYTVSNWMQGAGGVKR